MEPTDKMFARFSLFWSGGMRQHFVSNPNRCMKHGVEEGDEVMETNLLNQFLMRKKCDCECRQTEERNEQQVSHFSVESHFSISLSLSLNSVPFMFCGVFKSKNFSLPSHCLTRSQSSVLSKSIERRIQVVKRRKVTE